MDLPALQTIPFLHGNGLSRLQVSPCWLSNGLNRMYSGHRWWLSTVIVARLAGASMPATMFAWDTQLDGQAENVNRAVHMQFTHYDLWLITMLIMAVLSTCVHWIYQRRSTR